MKVIHIHATEKERPFDLLKKSLGIKGKPLGSGAFAKAWWSPKLRRVVKIGEQVDPYVEFLSLVKRSKSSLLPKIDKVIFCHEAGALRKDKDGAYAVIMERLYRPSSPRQRALMSIIIDTFETAGWSTEDVRVALKNVVKSNATSTFLEELLKVCHRVENLCDDYGYEMDMHDNNIMFRRNGQPVITDPYC